MQILAESCACPIAGCARFRHRTRQQLDAEILQSQNVFAATPAEVLVRCASTAQKICNEFARFLLENCSIVAPNARFNRRFFGAHHVNKAMQKFFNVNMFSQRRRPKFRCNACRPRGEFAMNSRVFWWKTKCAIAERAVFSARHTALTCTEAAPTSCDFQIGILAKKTQNLVRRAPKS